MPEKFEEGFVLTDIFKTNWTLGKPIGQGGFGLVYLGKVFFFIIKQLIIYIFFFKHLIVKPKAKHLLILQLK